MKYGWPVVLLKLAEYLWVVLIGLAALTLFPEYYPAGRGVVDHIVGAVIFATEFYVLSLYPVLSALLIYWLVSRGLRSRAKLGSISAVFAFLYCGALALGLTVNTGALPPREFWVALIFMALGAFVLALLLLPSRPLTSPLASLGVAKRL